MRIGVMTGGGDSSAINGFLFYLSQQLAKKQHQLVGFRHGWKGVVLNDTQALGPETLEQHKLSPGTILGTSRTNPIKSDMVETLIKTLEEQKIDTLVAVGGDDTLSVAAHLAKLGVRVIGVPQTIDNDIEGTEQCIGFSTSIAVATTSINTIIPSNIAHDRDMIVEVMGRDSGWIAIHTALNTGACACMCPEGMMTIDEVIRANTNFNRSMGHAGLMIVAEGIPFEGALRIARKVDEFNNTSLEGVGHAVSSYIAEKTGREPRVQTLGYLLRGGLPTPSDMELAADFACKTTELIEARVAGQMVAKQGSGITAVPLSDIVGRRRKIPLERLEKMLGLLG